MFACVCGRIKALLLLENMHIAARARARTRGYARGARADAAVPSSF